MYGHGNWQWWCYIAERFQEGRKLKVDMRVKDE